MPSMFYDETEKGRQGQILWLVYPEKKGEKKSFIPSPRGSQIFTSKINFNEIDREAEMVGRKWKPPNMMGLESIIRPKWHRPLIGAIRRHHQHRFRPNRYEQSLQGWRQHPSDEPEGQGFPPPPPHRQRSFRFNQGPSYRFQPRQQGPML
jgi:hypothetical protein